MDQITSHKLPRPIFPSSSIEFPSPFQCESCKLYFSYQRDLIYHISVEVKRFSCALCPVLFTTSKGMKQHFGKKHAKHRPYKCSLCLKRFRNVYAARIHKQQVHFHKARQVCGQCGKNVFNKYSLTRHAKVCRRTKVD